MQPIFDLRPCVKKSFAQKANIVILNFESLINSIIENPSSTIQAINEVMIIDLFNSIKAEKPRILDIVKCINIILKNINLLTISCDFLDHIYIWDDVTRLYLDNLENPELICEILFLVILFSERFIKFDDIFKSGFINAFYDNLIPENYTFEFIWFLCKHCEDLNTVYKDTFISFINFTLTTGVNLHMAIYICKIIVRTFDVIDLIAFFKENYGFLIHFLLWDSQSAKYITKIFIKIIKLNRECVNFLYDYIGIDNVYITIFNSFTINNWRLLYLISKYGTQSDIDLSEEILNFIENVNYCTKVEIFDSIYKFLAFQQDDTIITSERFILFIYEILANEKKKLILPFAKICELFYQRTGYCYLDVINKGLAIEVRELIRKIINKNDEDEKVKEAKTIFEYSLCIEFSEIS